MYIKKKKDRYRFEDSANMKNKSRFGVRKFCFFKKKKTFKDLSELS